MAELSKVVNGAAVPPLQSTTNSAWIVVGIEQRRGGEIRRRSAKGIRQAGDDDRRARGRVGQIRRARSSPSTAWDPRRCR